MLGITIGRTAASAEDYIWIAHLDDGSAYREYAGGEARGWKSVPEERRVVAVEIVPQRLHLHGFCIPIPDVAVAVFFRRRQLRIHLSTDGHVEPRGTITVLGWESATDARYWAVWPNGDNRVTMDKALIQ